MVPSIGFIRFTGPSANGPSLQGFKPRILPAPLHAMGHEVALFGDAAATFSLLRLAARGWRRHRAKRKGRRLKSLVNGVLGPGRGGRYLKMLGLRLWEAQAPILKGTTESLGGHCFSINYVLKAEE